MQRRSARNSPHGGGKAEIQTKTPETVLRPISRNLRSASKDGSSAAWTQRATEHVASKTPGKRLQLLQQTPNGSYPSTTKKPRITPGRGWLKPTTPHGVRALESRRAGLTPGRVRRQSVRLKRDTPRDLLRALSRAIPRPEKVVEEASQPPQQEQNGAKPTKMNNGATESDSGSDETPPRLSFGVNEDDSGFEVEKSRRASNNMRLSFLNSSMIGTPLDDTDESDDQDKPVTTLLDDDSLEIDLEPPEEATFGYRDQPGDTMALRNLVALHRDPETPGSQRRHGTPTADLSFQLDIPEFEPGPEPELEPDSEPDSEPPELPDVRSLPDDMEGEEGEFEDYDGPEDGIGGMELVSPDEDMAINTMGMDEEIGNEDGGAVLRVPSSKALDVRLAQKQAEKKVVRKYKKQGPKRDGLSKGIVKRVAASFIPNSGIKKGRLKRDAVDALVQATDWFFEQASEDLSAYSEHAGRRKIDESDFRLLARRQRILTPQSTLFSLASRFLPRELLRDVRSAPAEPKVGTARNGGRKGTEPIEEDA